MSQSTIQLKQKEQTAQFLWMGFIVAFFLIQAVVWVVAITLTANDKSNAVVAGYDEKALRWDEQVAQQRASNNLGWKTEWHVDPSSDVYGVHAITLKIVDRLQNPVAGATIEVTAFHRSRAGDPQSIVFNEINDGLYSGTIKIRKSGIWQFTGWAAKGKDVFLIDERQTLKGSR